MNARLKLVQISIAVIDQYNLKLLIELIYIFLNISSRGILLNYLIKLIF